MSKDIADRHFIKADPGWHIASYHPAEGTRPDRIELVPIVAWEVKIDRNGDPYVDAISVDEFGRDTERFAIKSPDGSFTADCETFHCEGQWIDHVRKSEKAVRAYVRRQAAAAATAEG
jgi:hypothetical protein